MARLAWLLFCISLTVNAEYGEKEHKVIVDVYHACKERNYTPQECRLAMQSNVDIKIPPFVICNLLKECGK